MNNFRTKTSRFAIILYVMLLCAALCGVLSACDGKSAYPLPTDSDAWVLESIVVESERGTTTYSVAVAEEIKKEYSVSDENTAEENEANMAKWIVYEGMYLDSSTVTVDFTSKEVILGFADGSDVYGTWKRSGDAMSASMIEYTFDGEKSAGTCGRVEEQDGARHLILYVVYGDTTFIFNAPV